MAQSANDWASPDPSKNMTLADSDNFANALVAALQVQFGDRFIRTQYGEVISLAELRQNNFMSPLPVNLEGRLAAASAVEFNVAEFRSQLRDAAKGDDPVGDLTRILSAATPGQNVAANILRIPLFADAVRQALQKL
ncbi:MAG TPA: hypothetical protein VKU01_17185 [Bryobacteraceae bacterium]|nr:hypothetical protein [Bryobacteraceae bacterium]